MRVDRKTGLNIALTGTAVLTGILTGNPILASLVGGVSANWLADLTWQGWEAARDRWLTPNGRFRHEALARAASRAFANAVADFPQTGAYHRLTPAQQKQCREGLAQLRRDSDALFQNHAPAPGQLLYATPEAITADLHGALADYFYGYPEPFLHFVQEQLTPRHISYHFGEALKHSEQARVAFEKLLLESLQAQMGGLQAGQQALSAELRDLQAWLQQWATLPTADQTAQLQAAFNAGLQQLAADLKAHISQEHEETRALIKQVAQVAPEPVTPQQRPPRAEHFTGRGAELTELMADLQPGAIVSICGPGGMGKTALAAEAIFRLDEAGELRQRFPDGVVVHSFYGQPDSGLALAHLVQSFQPGAQEFSGDAAQRTLAGKRALLVLDGAEEAEDLNRLLRLRGDCGVLITSRRRSDARGTWRDMAPLPLTEAITMLGQWPAEALDRAAAAAICEQVGRLPLAVQLAGRYLQTGQESAASYLAWLQTTPIQALSHGGHREESVAVLLQRSVAQVDETAQAVLGAMGLLAAAPFPLRLIADGLKLEERPARNALGALVNYGLLRREEEAYVVNHALVHRYAREAMTVERDVQQAIAGSLLALVDEIDVERQPSAALPTLPHLQAAAAWEAAEESELGAELCNAIGYWLDLLADYAGARPFYERALAIYEKTLGPDHPDTARSLNNLGFLLQAMGDLAAARPFYERALAIYEKALGPDHPDTARSLNNLGALLQAMGDLAAARPFYERALAIYEKALGPDHPDTALSLNNLGALLDSMGDLAGARPFYERALAIREKALGPDHPDTANSLNNLGFLLQAMGDLAAARPFYERALAIREKALGPDHPDTARSLNNLGYLLRAMGDLAGARPFVERALAIYEKALGPDHPDLAYSLNNPGMLAEAEGDLSQARVYLTRALSIFEKALGAAHPNSNMVRNNLQSLP